MGPIFDTNSWGLKSKATVLHIEGVKETPCKACWHQSLVETRSMTRTADPVLWFLYNQHMGPKFDTISQGLKGGDILPLVGSRSGTRTADPKTLGFSTIKTLNLTRGSQV